MKYICMLVDGSYPNDIRVRKEAEALVENGKKVVVVCPMRAKESKQEIINGVNIYRIGKNYSHTKKGIYDVVESSININPFFYFGLKHVFKKYDISVLHIHDLPLAGTGYAFKSRVQHLVLDLHENFPEALKTWFEWKKNPFIKWKNKIFMNPKKWSKKEEKYCRKYDTIVCVVQEMKEKLHANFNIDLQKMFVVSNHEKKEFADNFNKQVAQHSIDKSAFSITYVGGFGPHRGLDIAIQAMPSIVAKIPNAVLYLVGRGSVDVEKRLKALVKECQVEETVKFVGYRPFNEVATIMQLSKLNIIPHKANEHTNNTIPHKLFQIMMSKSLLVVSSCKPLKRIVEKYDAGLVFEADSSDDFSSKVIHAYDNFDQLKTLTENAFDAVMKNDENWDSESLKLVELYNNLIG